MKDSIQLKRVTNEDIDFIYSLICELEKTEFDFETFKINFTINMNNESIQYYKIQANEKDCGFISLYDNRLLHHNGIIMEIQEFLVSNRERGKEIGESAIKETIKIAKQKDVLQLEVCTNKERDRTQSFYKKCGFKESHYKYTMSIENK